MVESTENGWDFLLNSLSNIMTIMEAKWTIKSGRFFIKKKFFWKSLKNLAIKWNLQIVSILRFVEAISNYFLSLLCRTIEKRKKNKGEKNH